MFTYLIAYLLVIAISGANQVDM